MALDYGTRYYKLAGVKECLFHPRLPTFRRIDMDTAAHKLPDEHCRTTTPCTKENFNNQSVTIGLRTLKPFKQTYLGRNWQYRNYYSFLGDDEERDMDGKKSGEFIKAETTAEETAPKPYSSPYHFKQIPWKFSLQQEPFIDHIGQRPIPATTFSRYRSTSSLYGGQVSLRSWRP